LRHSNTCCAILVSPYYIKSKENQQKQHDEFVGVKLDSNRAIYLNENTKEIYAIKYNMQGMEVTKKVLE